VEGLSGDVLYLCENGLQVSGLRLTAPGLELPGDCGQAALALLWEYGRLNRNGLKATFSVQTLANEYGVCYNN